MKKMLWYYIMTKYKDCNALVIHLPHSYDRWRYINDIRSEFPNLHIIEGIEGRNTDEKYLSMCNFKRTPYLRSECIQSRVGCFLSHKKCLEYIVTNKLENIIVFEDDAIFIHDDFLQEDIEEGYDIIYLGYKAVKNSKRGTYRIDQTHAIYYKDYEIAETILEYMDNNPHKWTSWNLFLDKEILPVIKYKLNKWIDQVSSKEVKSLINVQSIYMD